MENLEHYYDEELPENENQYILENSSDIAELERAAITEKDYAPYNRLLDWQQQVLSLHTTPESFSRFVDRNYIGLSLAKRFLRKNGMPLDEIAKFHFNEEVTPEQIGYLMYEVATDSSLTRKTTDLYNDIKNKISRLKKEQKAITVKSKIDIQMVFYSEKSVVLIGDTFKVKEKIKQMGGKFNKYLSCGAGWVFPAKKKQELLQFINENC